MHQKVIEAEFWIGDIVVPILHTMDGHEQPPMPGQVLAVWIEPGTIMFEVAWADMTKNRHYAAELAKFEIQTAQVAEATE